MARYMIGLNSLPDLHRAFANFAAVIVHRYCLDHALPPCSGGKQMLKCGKSASACYRCKTEAMDDPTAATTIARAQKIVDTSLAALKSMGQPLVAPRDWYGLVGRCVEISNLLSRLT